jgi:hypothetical protein
MNPHGEEAETGARSSGVVSGPFARELRCVFGRPALYASLLVLLVMALMGNLANPEEKLRDPDLWWHLADARILTTSHSFIAAEPYSFTVAGQRWINPEWLSELPFWLGYRSLGLRGIYLVTVAGLCANLLFVYWRSWQRSGHSGAAFWTAILGFLLMTVNGGPRTIMIAYLALSAEMAVLEAAERGSRRLLWLLPPLFCVWINLHGSWIIGLGLLGIYIFSGFVSFRRGIFDQEGHSRSERKRLLVVFMASLAALFVNPYGWRLIWNPLDMMLNQRLMISNVEEWQPLNLGRILGCEVLLAIGLTIAANCLCARRWKVYEMVFLLYVWVTAIEHARFTFLACVVAFPMLTEDLARSFFRKPSEKTIPTLNALFTAAALWAAAMLFPTEARLEKGVAAQLPLETIASIQPSWRTYNAASVGGMMDFRFKPTFVDTRWDTFEHHDVLQDFFAISRLEEPLKLLDKYQIDHVLVPESWSLTYLLERTPGWQVARREGSGDDAYILFARAPGGAGDQSQCAAGSAEEKR